LSSESDLPILIIPNGVGYSDVNKILFAFDYRHVSNVPMSQAIQVAQLTGAELVMLQIIEERWTHQIETELLAAQKRIRESWSGTISLKFETIYADDHDRTLKIASPCSMPM
jgi:hypothetical protein